MIMYRKIIGLLLIFTGLFSSCKSGVPREEEKEEVAEASPSHLQIVQMGIQKLPHWVDHWEMQERDFDKTAFAYHQQVTYEMLEWPEENQTESHYPLHRYQIPHPEDKGVVDIYDYKVEIGESGQVGLNPDSEVAYFRANGMKERLMFMGPSGVFEDAVWVTGAHLLVAGHIHDGEAYSPRLWLVIPDEQSYLEFRHPFATTEYRPEQYIKKKLATIEIP